MLKDMGFWVRHTGFANSSQCESLFVAWKGAVPNDIAKFRLGCLFHKFA